MTSIRPVRIRKQIYSRGSWLILLPMILFLTIGIIGLSQWWSGGPSVWSAVFFLGFGIVAFLMSFHPLLLPPFWVQVGDRLTYRTLLGVHTHEWSGIKAIQFRHNVHEDVFCVDLDNGDTLCVVSTELVITFANEKRICLRNVNRPHARAASSEVIRTLVNGLRPTAPWANDPHTRRRAAEALARFSPDVVLYSATCWLAVGFIRAAAEAQLRADAFKAVLGEAVPYLNELMQDPDENVREAATEALRRTAHASHQPRTIGEPGTRILRRNKPREWRCPSCGETVPSNFDVCWNCQGLRPKSRDAPDE
jgi:hypothetical protein